MARKVPPSGSLADVEAWLAPLPFPHAASRRALAGAVDTWARTEVARALGFAVSPGTTPGIEGA